MASSEKQVDRRMRLSATDMVSLYGVSPYQGASEHSVYLDHVHPEARKPAGDEPAPLWKRLGNAVEPMALAYLTEKTGKKLRRSATRTCESHPWLRARPDALVVDGLPDPRRDLSLAALGPKGARRAKASEVCEVKFISDPRMAMLWFEARPRPPLYVHVQAQAEMTACKLSRACGIGIVMGNPYVWELRHDPELEAEILAIGENFLRNHIQTSVPPTWDGSKAADRLLMARWPKPDATFRRAAKDDFNLHGLARTWLDLDKEIKALEKKQGTAAQALKELIGDRIGILGDGWKATWKAPRVGQVSWKDVATDLWAKIAAEDLWKRVVELAGGRGPTIPETIIDQHRSEPTRKFRMYERDAKAAAAGITGDDFDLEDFQEALEG
jgi:predicted phage-related endonuclease